MTIYVLSYNDDTGCVSDEFVTKVEDIEQLAIDFYWGTITEPEPGRLIVRVDMAEYTVKITDTGIKGRPGMGYDILEFTQKNI
jgi:hypothetical protein